ncbi:MAG: UDP-N-acetylmuramoyl-tripeptide--D-alanyl-D-alanine ligase [Patescibacteria group bacterium]
MLIKHLRWVVKKLSQLTIWKYRPGIVGITGSVGKTSTKAAIKAVLDGERNVRSSRGNLNNELGLPLAILGNWSEKELKLVSLEQPAGTARARKIFFWLKVIVSSVFRLIFVSKSNYPEILVLEYGADHPGDLKYLLNIARPNISVITAIGEVPVHVEFYNGPDEVAREKGRLIEYLPVAGSAILNYDDKRVIELQERTRAHIITFGFNKGAEIRITRFSAEGGPFSERENSSEENRPAGISFKLDHRGNSVPVRLDGVFGKSHAYASAAAAAVGVSFGLNLLRISENLLKYRPAESRMQIKHGIADTWIIDDSYNASPLSMQISLEALEHLKIKRKIAVLGDMLEIGKHTTDEHKRVGRLAAKSCDVLITVGLRAKFIAESAHEAGLRKNKIFSFDTADDAVTPIKQTIRKGDVILIKGSHGMGLSKIVHEIKQKESNSDSFFSHYA